MMKIRDHLNRYRNEYHPLFSPDLIPDNTFLLDLSGGNGQPAGVPFRDPDMLGQYIFDTLLARQAIYAYGGYMEDREMYRRSPLFAGAKDTARSIHLGTDVWAAAGTAVYLPLEGIIHSFQNNTQYGDYGPTIIVEHRLHGVKFHTLYGHLAAISLMGLKEQRPVKAGNIIGTIGDAPENGDWPPHLHFQVITDMKGNKGDFPGVCFPQDKTYYQSICPNPDLFFQKLFPAV